MNLLQIIAAVAGNTKRTDKDDVARTGVTLGWQRCSVIHPFRGLIRTDEIAVASQANNVPLSGSPVRIYAAYWINGTGSWRIMGRSREWVVRRVPNIDASPTPSYPTWSYLDGNTLHFVPGANDEGQIKVTYQYVPTMVEDADENPVPLLDEAIISYSTSWVFKSVQLWNEANFWESNYQNALQLAIDADRSQPFDEKRFDQRGEGNEPFIEPYLDPFQGHNMGWWSR